MAWGKGQEPSYTETPVTAEQVKADLAWLENGCNPNDPPGVVEHHKRQVEFLRSLDTLTDGERVFEFVNNQSHSGNAGYLVKSADGTIKSWISTTAWMS